MSLINKALKQEQMKRSRIEAGELPPFSAFQAQAAAPQFRDLRAKQPSGKGTWLLLGFVAIGLLFFAAIGAFLYLGSSYISQANGDASASETGVSSGLVEKTLPSLKTGIAASLLEETLAASKELTSLNQAFDSKNVPADPQSAASQSPPAKAETAEPASKLETLKNSLAQILPGKTKPTTKPNFETQEFVDNLRFQAVRLSGPDTRFMMNGRVYKIGYTIDHEKGLVFADAFSDRLIFVDPEGHRYEKFY